MKRAITLHYLSGSMTVGILIDQIRSYFSSHGEYSIVDFNNGTWIEVIESVDEVTRLINED